MNLQPLTEAQAQERLRRYGPNRVARAGTPSVAREVWTCAWNPLNALLVVLAIVSALLGELRAAVVIAVIVALATVTAFVQQHRANRAAATLRALVRTTATVRRGTAAFAEIPMD